jgi:hypothetical protein
LSRFLRMLFPEKEIAVRQDQMSTLQSVAEGMYWIDRSGKRTCLGGVLQGLKDYRRGREHEPFPVMAKLSSYIVGSKQYDDEPAQTEQYIGAGDWSVGAFRYKQWKTGKRGGQRDQSIPSSAELSVLSKSFSRDFPDQKLDIKQCQFEYPTRFRHTRASKDYRVSVGDHVCVEVKNQSHVMRINKAIVVVLPDKRHIPYIFPFWYNHIGEDPLLGVKTVRARVANLQHNADPVLLQCVREQVMIVCKCKHECDIQESASHDPSNCEHRCRLVHACPLHQRADCKDAACANSTNSEQLIHRERGVHLLFDHQTGFVANAKSQPLGSMGSNQLVQPSASIPVPSSGSIPVQSSSSIPVRSSRSSSKSVADDSEMDRKHVGESPYSDAHMQAQLAAARVTLPSVSRNTSERKDISVRSVSEQKESNGSGSGRARVRES